MTTSGKIAITILLFVVVASAEYVITTFAGGGAPGTGAGRAAETPLEYPSDVAADGLGNFFLASPASHQIYKVDAAGNLTTLAGTGEPGFAGDGGPAVHARLDGPQGLATGLHGTLFIADSGNNRIRRVDSDGTIATLAGTGERGFSGEGGSAANARLNAPFGVASDLRGNVFVADTFNHRIRMVDHAGNITTIAGYGRVGFSGDGGRAVAASLSHPNGVALDAQGHLYIADTLNHRVRKVDPDGNISTIAGLGAVGFSGDGGPAVNAMLAEPTGLAVDGAGNLLIADFGNSRVRRVDAAGVITTVAGTGASAYSGDSGPAMDAGLNRPQGVAADGAGNVLVADALNHRVRKVNAMGTISTIAGNGAIGDVGDHRPASEARLSIPTGVAADRFGNIFIADSGHDRIRRVDVAGIVATVAGTGGHGSSGDGGVGAGAEFAHPTGVAVDGSGNLLIADMFNHRVRRLDASGIVTTIAGAERSALVMASGSSDAQVSFPHSVATDMIGSVFIADSGNNRIVKADSRGVVTTVVGRGRRALSLRGAVAFERIQSPHGVALDPSGSLLIADTGNHRILKVSPAGVVTTLAGIGRLGYSGDGRTAARARLSWPMGVTSGESGEIFIADSGNHRVRRINASGVITTIAGTGKSGFSGDGGPAARAQLFLPTGVAVDGSGTLFVADRNNHRIRKLTPASFE